MSRDELENRSGHGIRLPPPRNMPGIEYLEDTVIDWSYNLMDRGLKFNNPSAMKVWPVT